MVKVLGQALAEVAELPEAAQEKIGRELLAHLQKLRSLRGTVDRSVEGSGSYTDEDVEASIAERLNAWERRTAGR